MSDFLSAGGKRRVVVTGMGIVSPVGNDLATAWAHVTAGKSGITPITRYDVSTFPTKFAGQVLNFNAADWMNPKEARRVDPFIHYGVAAAKMAVKDSGLEITDSNRERIGICVGSGIGGIGTIEEQCNTLAKDGIRRVSPFFVPSSIINMAAGHISIDLGITGPNLATVSACTTAAHSIGLAYRMLQYGDAEVFVAGGAEAGSAPAGMAGFCQARALSSRNESPQQASRPWDKDRDGFVLGDGAGIVVLETLESAQKRGARIYAEMIGFGMSGDAHHITAPPEDGDGARRSMVAALKDSGISADRVDYINAHGTSTPLGDVAETRAVKGALGAHASEVAISSTKSMTGHLLGAAGGIEAIFSVLALRDQVIPPTINLDQPGEGCDLDYVPHHARPSKLTVAMSNSFGFGGTNGTLVFKRF